MRIEEIEIEKLVPAKYNPRKDLKPGDPQYENLKKSILEFDYVDPIIWNEQTGHIIGGHQRFKILKDLGNKKLFVSVVNLSLEKEKALNVGLNKISGEWDDKALEELLREITTFDIDMALTGFSDDELSNLLRSKNGIIEDDFDLDDHLINHPEPDIKQGDIFSLGNHRLMCGSSTDVNDVHLLLAGGIADMVFTDPPYNVALGMDETPEEAKKRNRRTDGLIVKNDSMSDNKFYQFLFDAYSAALEITKKGGAIYVCHADLEGINFRTAFKAAGWDLKQCIIWVKNSIVMGRQDHHWKHEPILYGWKPGAAHKWNGDRKQSTVIQENPAVVVEKKGKGFTLTFDTGMNTIVFDVPSYEVKKEFDDSETTTWFFNKPLKNAIHPTMKPIAIPSRAIKNSSKPGDIILDGFGGSGSTLMAAEQLERSCYMMELDPVYCDAIIARWEQFTNKKAEKVR